MTANHDAVAAVPTVGNVSKTLLRNVLVARMPYVLGDAESLSNIIAIDPSTGAVIVDVLLLGRVFHYDASDRTTVADGTTCLVSADGLRYKLALGTDVFCYAVLDNTLATPPVSPALGDAYLVAAAATGAWAGKSNFIAVKTARGWEFVNFGIGRFIYVESVETYYHKNSGGSWVPGFGSQIFGANTVPLSAAINFGKRVIVENQTTTAPPGSPTVGTAYIIGPSATGGWAGLDGKIAICEVAGSFVVYTPSNGWAAYDKAQNNDFTFKGSAWSSSAGAIVNQDHVFTDAAVININGTTAYSQSATPPTTSSFGNYDTGVIAYAAKKTGALLRIKYRAEAISYTQFASGANDFALVVALFIDSNVNASDWHTMGFGVLGVNTDLPAHIDAEFFVTTSDALSHSYAAAVLGARFNNVFYYAPQLSRRRLIVEEFA